MRTRSRRRNGRREPAVGLPSPQALLEFLRDNPEALSPREIGRAFGLGADQQPALRALLRAISRSGELVRGGDQRFAPGTSLPDILEIERQGSDADGMPLARPVTWSEPGEAPLFRLVSDDAAAELPEGARATARLIRRDSGEVELEPLRRIDPAANRIVGVFRRGRDGGEVVPADRRDKNEYRVLGHDAAGVADGELVIAEQLPAHRFGPRARIVERLGAADAPGAISRLTIAAFDIPSVFPPEALAEAAAPIPMEMAGRADLRELELVTIDGADARDFDDAVWAEPDVDPENRGGWHIVVAIADVAWYVRRGGALDREAASRGNSVYLPDRVVPMLPEALSNDLCSLRPGEDRACLAAHLWIDASGGKLRHRFERAVMRSAARLTYEAVQAAHDDPAGAPLPLPGVRLAGLYGAYAALDRARRARGALELDLAEYRVVLDPHGQPVAVVPRTRVDSHRLIEEFMILANVAAAEELEARHQPCLYRVHDAPDPAKLAALRDFLAELDIPGLALAKGQVIRPALFNRVLERAAETPEAAVINELVLRSQAQAVYSPNNIGHFGLALPRYAHFTSPIRRYADLLVHRALLAGSHGPPLGGEALGGEALGGETLAAVADHISLTERRAAAAERAALDRYRAALMSTTIGALYEARVTGVAPFGLFVKLPESGTDGLVPVASLTGDYYDHDPARHRLTGRRYGRHFGLGDAVRVRLVEADPVGGRLLFRLEGEPEAAPRRSGPRRVRTLRRRR